MPWVLVQHMPSRSTLFSNKSVKNELSLQMSRNPHHSTVQIRFNFIIQVASIGQYPVGVRNLCSHSNCRKFQTSFIQYRFMNFIFIYFSNGWGDNYWRGPIVWLWSSFYTVIEHAIDYYRMTTVIVLHSYRTWDRLLLYEYICLQHYWI